MRVHTNLEGTEVSKVKNAYEQAVEDLAAEHRNRQWPDNITADEAREYLDTEVISIWVGQESINSSFSIVLAEVVAQRMSDMDALAVLAALNVESPQMVMMHMREALVEQVARALAYDATKHNENLS